MPEEEEELRMAADLRHGEEEERMRKKRTPKLGEEGG